MCLNIFAVSHYLGYSIVFLEQIQAFCLYCLENVVCDSVVGFYYYLVVVCLTCNNSAAPFLARKKQKWSVDPRNSTWSNDDTKFGQKMLERMGWSKGKVSVWCVISWSSLMIREMHGGLDNYLKPLKQT